MESNKNNQISGHWLNSWDISKFSAEGKPQFTVKFVILTQLKPIFFYVVSVKPQTQLQIMPGNGRMAYNVFPPYLAFFYIFPIWGLCRDVEGAQEDMPAIQTKYVDYMDLAGGEGSSPKPGDMVMIGLKGKIQSSGFVFVDTFSGNRPSLSFVLGAKPYPEGICEGLEYAIQTMKTGGLRRATIPPDFGYGEMGAVLGGDISIPPAATLEYVVELQKVSVPTS